MVSTILGKIGNFYEEKEKTKNEENQRKQIF